MNRPPLTPEDWATTWLRHSYHHAPEDFWAWEELTETVHDDPERAWPVILALVALAQPDRLEYVGAGPLEHLIENHDQAFIDRINAQAASDPRFRETLASVWLNRRYHPPAIVARLVAASGGAIKPLEFDYEPDEDTRVANEDGA